jgi:Glycosyl transferase family 2
MTRLICLLPARNAAQELPGFLESAGSFCDAIVALDDGSTDQTAEILGASPLVKTLLRNPRREDFRGWDDSLNRNRLLSAAAGLEPEWIISVDADERIDNSDADALRCFLETDALPGCAYRFQWLQMREDAHHYFPEIIWIPRLFAFAPGQKFPSDRLHFAPVPTSIPKAAYLKTTLRIQHFGAMTEDLRRARFEKYRQADPQSAFWSDYSVILSASSSPLLRFEPRDPNLPVLLLETDGGEREELHNPSTRNPGTVHVAAEDSLLLIDCANLPSVRSVGDCDSVEFVLITGPGMSATVESRKRIVAAHRAGFAVVAPAVRASLKTKSGRASYLLEFHAQLPGLGATSLTRMPMICSYALTALRDLETAAIPFEIDPQGLGVMNCAFERSGYIGYRESSAEVDIDTYETGRLALISKAFSRGRFDTRRWIQEQRPRGRLLSRKSLPVRLIDQPRSTFGAIRTAVANAEPQFSSWFEDSNRHIKLGLGSEALGSVFEMFRPERGKLALLAGRESGFVLITLKQGFRSGALLARFDAAKPFLRGVWFGPDTLEVITGNSSGHVCDLFAARELGAAFCGAPVDGLVEIDLTRRSRRHPTHHVVRRLLGDDRIAQLATPTSRADQGKADRSASGVKTSIAKRDFAFITWTFVRIPNRAISIIDYPAGENPRSMIVDHLGHGGDTTSNWQAGPRDKRAM